MLKNILNQKPVRVFTILMSFFVANALIAECIGGKIFNLEALIGIRLPHFDLFGEKDLTFALTCGVLLWPLEFVMTDIVNEYFGPKAVRRISYTAVALISYAFLMFYFAMSTTPPDWWVHSKAESGVPDMQKAFSAIFGQGMWIILGSLIAFLVSQVVDVLAFHRIKKATGDKWLWMRATGSTLISQLVDSYIVLFVAFYIGQGWSWQKVLAIGTVNYMYKAVVALLMTPVIYLIEKRIEAYVGKQTAQNMKKIAMGEEEDLFMNIPTAG
jgi:queuosine precursor transporter